MAKYSNTVEYNISTKLDGSGLTKLQAQIKQLENSMQQMSNRELIDEEKVRSAKAQLEKLNAALTNSFNSSLGILDLSKFRAELDSSGVSALGLQSAFNMMGAEGQAALNGLTTQIADFNGGMERTSSAVDKIFTTFSNTFRWGLISSFFSNFMNSIHQSVDYVKELDDSLTQIMLVTDYNRDAMNQYAKSANEAAKAVSMTTTGMTNASLVFAQQGYNLNQSQELATLSAKLANASQQDTATTSDQITAYMNAYGLQNNIAELSQAMDNWALIANVSAADVSELAQASQRAASMANTVGVSGEQLAAQIATIESVTREAPEQIGNGLKTLYARFSDISAGGEDEEGVSLGDVTKQLNDLGVQVLDQFGNIRDIGDIMEDLMFIWDDLDQTSKIAAAQALAGKYQVNRFVSLMDNSDMYREYLGATGGAATGTLDQMNQEYADSIAGRSAKLQASLEGLFSTIFNTDDIYPWMDAAQGAVDLLQQFFDALGGGKTVLLSITSLLTQAFSQNIARSINDTIANRNLGQVRQQNIDTVSDTLDRVGIDRTQGVGAYIDATAQQAKLGALSDAQYDDYMNNVRQWADASTALVQSEEELTDTINTVNLVFGKVVGETEAAVLSKDGLNTFSATENRASLSNKEIMQRIQGTDFSDVASQAQVVSLALKEVQSQFDTTTKDSEELGHSIDWVQDQLHTLSTEMNGYSSTSADNMIQALQQMRIELDENGKLSETSAKQLQRYIREMQQLSVIAANMDETSARRVMADAGDSAQKIKGNVDFNRTQEERAGRNARNRQKGIDDQQRIKGVLDTVSAVQQLTSAWQIAANLPAILDDEDLDVSEKMTQLIMNLTPVIMMSTNAFKAMKDAAKTFTAAEGEATIATELLGGALTFLTSGPGIALVAALAAIGFAIHAQAEEAKKAHEQAMVDFEEAKNIQQQTTDLSSQIDDWKSKRNTQGNTKELAQEADTLADSFKELGNEEEAEALHLAVIRAEANGTTASFNELENALNAANQSMADQSALDTMEAANAILKDRLSTTEELTAANEAMQSAALDYNINQMSRTAGMDMGITGVNGDNDLRAATMDWQSLQTILDQSVPGFAEIIDENKKLALALSHTSDEALRAAIQIEQLANANTNLTEGQQTSITQKLEGSGFSAQESLQLMASLDENASYQEIVKQIEEVKQQVNAGTPFEVVLQAKMDPEQLRKSIQESLATYEPKDEDVDAVDFQSLSNMFMNNADKMGEEGTPFVDYSEDLLNDAAALEEVVEGILRYDDAIQSIDSNLENWQEALENTNEFSKEHIDAVQELQETYADFLDLAEDMGVSEEFAANADNLKLMEDAANGVEGAYEDLAQAAAEDILIHADVDDIDNAKEALNGLFDYLNSDAFSNLNIGDALDLSGIEDQINALADATGWTADQMAAYLNSIGINIDPNMFEPINTALDQADANTAATANHIEGVVEGVADTVVDNLSYSTDTEMTAQTDTQNDQVMYTNLIPHAGMTTTIASTFPVGSANPTAGGAGAIETQTALAHVTGVEYTAQPITESQVKEMTGYGVKSEVKKGAGNGGGGVHLKKGATGSKGSRGVSGAGKSSGGSRPSSSGGGGGRGGGGGGSGKTYNAKTKEPVKKEKNLYERVNTQLDDIETTLKGIEKEEDRLIGDKARANMNKQIQLLDREIDLQKEKLAIQKKEQADLAKELTGYGYRFDSNGFIGNYNQVITNYEKRINDLINQYNRTTTEDGQEKLAKQIETLEKEYDKAKKAADRYDQLQGKEIQDTLNSIEELQDAIEDLRIDAWKTSTEAIDNLKELRENAADLEGFFSEYESDSPFRDLIIEGERLNNIWSIGKEQAEAYYNEIIADKQKALATTTDKAERIAIQNSINYFKALRDNLSDIGVNNGLLGLAYQDMLQLKEWFENPSSKDNVFGENTAALREAYEEAYNRVHDMTLEYEKEIENYRDSIIDAYDEIEDKQDRQIDKFDRIVEKLETFSDMYALYYGDESYSVMRDVLQQQGNTLREQLNQQREIYAYWANQYAQAIEVGDEKLIQELEDKMNDAEDKITDLAKDAAEAFAESYENAVKASTQYIIQNTLGDRNFDRLDRNWEWDKDYIEKYRDDVEKAYEMDKLRNKYIDLLNQAQGASLQTQNRIRAQMQEQLDLLDGQATVSEYDVKLANAKLEILQKQIALEDAQRNKNRMQLRRDTQGNYRYVYTANQDDVNSAQQELTDSEYDAYELSKNQQINNYDDLINAYQRYLSQREEILNNANLSEQEKIEQNRELYDRFMKYVDTVKEDFNDATLGTLDSLNWLILNGTEYTASAAVDMLNKMLDEQGNIKDQTKILWMDNAIYLTQEVIPKISEAIAAADDDIEKRLVELKENMVGSNGVLPAISQGIEGPDGVIKALNNAKYSTDELVVSTNDLMEALNGDNTALAEAQSQLQNYREELEQVKNASSVLANQLDQAQKQLDKSQAESLNYKTQLDKLKSGEFTIQNGQIVDPNAKKAATNTSGKKKKKNGDWTGFTGSYHYDSWGSSPSGDWYSGKANAVRISSFSRQSGYGPYNVHLETASGGWLGWVKESQLFDTGGYTGKWTDGNKRENGKLAFLHQKELVLNAEDTQNILAAVDIVRQIGVGLRNSAMNVKDISGKNFSAIGETIEQRVEITATFPNATDADDIRQAIIGLADKAYQYSHRNR